MKTFIVFILLIAIVCLAYHQGYKDGVDAGYKLGKDYMYNTVMKMLEDFKRGIK